jgi:hypothetical protein
VGEGAGGIGGDGWLELGTRLGRTLGLHSLPPRTMEGYLGRICWPVNLSQRRSTLQTVLHLYP